MITNSDIKRIVEAVRVAFREEFTTKTEFYELKNDYRNLQTSVDHIAKRLDTYHQEVVVLHHRVDRLENKVGVD